MTSCVFFILAFVGYVAAGPRCYECRDIASPIDCGYSTTCADNQECYLEQFVSSGGLVLYNTGCQSALRCQASGRRSTMVSLSKRQSSDVITCAKCCQGDFCNDEGCGITAPVPPQRGPNCFGCTKMAYPSECRQVITCEPGQLCLLYETNSFGRTLYDSRCERKAVCDAFASVPIGRRRQNTVQLFCHNCCAGDYCNDRCNASTVASTTKPPTMTTFPPSTKALSATSVPTSTTTLSTSKLTTTHKPTATSSISSSTVATSSTGTTSSTGATSMSSARDTCQQHGYSYASFLHTCFKFYNQGLNWTSANAMCMKEGGLLAIVESKFEWDFFKLLLAEKHTYTNQYIWLGASDVNHNNTFYWLTGDIVTFNDWRYGKPDGFIPGTNGKCVAAMEADNFHWHDISCGHENPFICTRTV